MAEVWVWDGLARLAEVGVARWLAWVQLLSSILILFGLALFLYRVAEFHKDTRTHIEAMRREQKEWREQVWKKLDETRPPAPGPPAQSGRPQLQEPQVRLEPPAPRPGGGRP